jgi:hypothetical protein
MRQLVPNAAAAIALSGLSAVVPRHAAPSKAHLIGDAIWAQKSVYVPPEPIDTSAQAEAKRERKKAKRLIEELVRRVCLDCHFPDDAKGKGGPGKNRINVHKRLKAA